MPIYEYDVNLVTYIENGPECFCGNRSWFVNGNNQWKCSNRGLAVPSVDRGIMRGAIINGPKCFCDGTDWFVGVQGICCPKCDRWREVRSGVSTYIVNGPPCSCGGVDWVVGNDGTRKCTRCDGRR